MWKIIFLWGIKENILCITCTDFIDFVRKERKSEYYANSFQWLYNEAKKWWKENRKGDPEPDFTEV